MKRTGQILLRTLLLVLVAACTRRVPPPTIDTPPPHAPDLTGAKIMVLPVQATAGVPDSVVSAFDAELAFWLADRAPRVHWIDPREMEHLVARAPGFGLDLHALDVRAFGRMRLTRIGDPLFGDLRRLGAIADAPLALLPVSLALKAPAPAPGDTGRAGTAGAARLEAAVALIDSTSGNVLWFAVVAGEPAPGGSPGGAAEAARAVARALLP